MKHGVFTQPGSMLFSSSGFGCQALHNDPCRAHCSLRGRVYPPHDGTASTRLIFNAYGVDYLHGVEFHHRKAPFNMWSPIKQRTFVIELFDIVRRTVEFGVSFSVRKDAYLHAKTTHARNRNESAYGYAFRGALDHIL